MNAIVINGSPRVKSNTMRLTRAFLDGAGFDAEIIDAAKLDIKPCLGCFGCWKNTPGKCVINDDMSGILNQIIGADVIIWSFPPYYFSVPSGLKALIDRQLPLNLPFMSEESVFGAHAQRYDLPRKRVAAISTCGFWTAAGNYDGVAAMFDRMYGKDNWSKIFCGQGELFRVPELSARTFCHAPRGSKPPSPSGKRSPAAKSRALKPFCKKNTALPATFR